jgi:hypothetical protein
MAVRSWHPSCETRGRWEARVGFELLRIRWQIIAVRFELLPYRILLGQHVFCRRHHSYYPNVNCLHEIRMIKYKIIHKLYKCFSTSAY